MQHIWQSRPTTEEMREVLSEEELNKASEYERAKMKFAIVRNFGVFVKDIAVLCFIGKIYSRMTISFIGDDTLFFLKLFLIEMVASIPFTLYSDFVLEEQFGYNKKTLATWITDLIFTTLIMSVISVFAYSVCFKLIEKFRSFWLYIAIFMVLFKLFMFWIYPIAIAPIFNKFTPMDKESQLYKSIISLAKQVDFQVGSIYTMDGSKRSGHSNAYFTGLGKTKRIVFYDTLLTQMTSDRQILAVLGHEFGHYKNGDTLCMLGLNNVIFTGILYAFNRFCERYKLPTGICLYVFMVYSGPALLLYKAVFNSFCRFFERRADAFAVKLGFASDLIGALKVLVVKNGSTLKICPLYSLINRTHPSPIERIEHIKQHLKPKTSLKLKQE
ncbi:FACE1 [Enterospora canceri]|uniref:CAAX prenyl protease n=1 Tax=Enterospora canceri TaxID=1081671 RepID=A0A1Y1S6N1_9MICR|nr:FACE1 [Enterospora canceri]